MLVVRPLYRRLIAGIIALIGPSIAALVATLAAILGTVLFAGAALAEVFVNDTTVEISGTGPRTSRSCTIVLKPVMAFGDSVAPRLAFVTVGTSRLSFGVEKPTQYSGVVIVQDNTRKAITGTENASADQLRTSDIGKAMKSGRLFYVTAQRSDNGKFVSSRYERIDFDAILAKAEAFCPIDAESLMTDLSARERAESALSVSLSDLSLIRWALGKKYGGMTDRPEPRMSLSPAERTLLRRYTADNGLPASRFLTAESARKLIAEGNTLTSDLRRQEAEKQERIAREAREAAAAARAREAEEEEEKRKKMTWTISKDFGAKIGVEFYSQDRKFAWPGGNKQFTIDDNETHTYSLNCNPGEKICYGAWLNSKPNSRYWGTGIYGKKACKGCCGTCGSESVDKRLTW